MSTAALPTPRTGPEAGVTDLLGTPATEAERAVLDVYERIVATLHRDDLPPCAAANLRAALAPVAVAVTDLGLRFDHLTDLGV